MPGMDLADAFGTLASCLVLATFSCREMLPLRLLAIASNIAFITYAMMLSLMPVLVLHVILLPVNFRHLLAILRRNQRAHAD